MSIIAIKSVRDWVEYREMSGHSSFSHAEVCAAFPRFSAHAVSCELSRLVKAGVIASVHKGFFVTIPTSYKLTGIVPPLFYIDDLFKYLGKPYYASLLTAAKMWGSSHQMAQVEFVTTVKPLINMSKGKQQTLKWVYRSSIPQKLICVRNGEGGVIRYSSSEFTALDLVQYAHLVGGLSSVATVLSDLVESVDFSKCDNQTLFGAVKGTVVQRTGFILETILGESEHADALYEAYREYGARPSWTELNPTAKGEVIGQNEHWKIRINCNVEPDET